ncbi:hypothetical protein SDC9_95323 [bioreactor metagenome]|uniref:Uncharacterized protein n=1 Tax=bioreactor metagenome TaxID=1076179 RepID=A0A645A699_9ZZZZ
MGSDQPAVQGKDCTSQQCGDDDENQGELGHHQVVSSKVVLGLCDGFIGERAGDTVEAEGPEQEEDHSSSAEYKVIEGSQG